MLKSGIYKSSGIIRLLGNLMRCRQAQTLARAPRRPAADAAVAMAFALREDGSVNLPTQSIAARTIHLHKEGLARRLIFFGSAQANGVTEATAMDRVAGDHGIAPEFRSRVHDPDFQGDLKDRDLVLLGQEFDRLNVESSYLVAHPLHLGRAHLLFKKRFSNVTFYPVEAERIYDRASNQLRCRAEKYFVAWNILAFTEYWIKGKI
ncbi:ElyC/SanA/YdcF family protein [Candidatus Margulisiibacteriota bacterium]